MRAIGTAIIVLFFALLFGVGSALYRGETLSSSPDFQVGPWQGSLHAGSQAADGLTRAVIARTAMLALNREEAIYYIASTDNDGRALSSSCRYSLTGGDMPARWWSITAYGPDYFLIPNVENRYSITQTDIQAAGEGEFLVELAADGVRRSPDSLVLSNGTGPGQTFSLLLRLYHPSQAVLAAPEGLAVPIISNLGCL